MSIDFAGVAVNLLPDDYRDWLTAYHSLDDFLEADLFDFDRTGLESLPLPPEPVQTQPQVGTLVWPTGMSRCGIGHYVVDGVALDAIDDQLAASAGPANLVLSDGTNTRTFSLYKLTARPLSKTPSGNGAYLLTLVDKRWYLRTKTGSIDSLPASWADLLSTLASQLGVTLTPDPIDADYGVPTSQWLFDEKQLAPVLDAACNRIGHRLVANLDGTFKTVSHATAKSLSDAQTSLTKTAGGLIRSDDLQYSVPASVKVVFRSVSGTPHSVTKNLSDLSLTGFGSSTGVSGQSVTVYGETVYTGTNAAACDSYAAQAATDWYDWQLADADLSLTGIAQWSPTGLEDRVEWKYGIDRLLTRVVRGPFQTFTQGALQGESDEDSCQGCEWTAGLIDTDCLLVSVDGVSTGVVLSSLDGGVTWTSDGLTVTICDTQYSLRFTPDNPSKLLLEGVGGSGHSGTPSYEGTVGCCDCNYIVFGFPKRKLCPSTTRSTDGPCFDTVKVRLDWADCDGYTVHATCCTNPLAREICVDSSVHTGNYAVLPATFVWGANNTDANGGGWSQTTSFGNDGGGRPQYWAVFPCQNPCGGGGAGASTHLSFGYMYYNVLSADYRFQVLAVSNDSFLCPDSGAFTFTFSNATAVECATSPSWDLPNITVKTDLTGCGACTPISGWDGPGYYCVVDVGNPCSGAAAVFLTDGDKCDASLTICSGPYSTPSEAAAACSTAGGVATACCPSDNVPTTVHGTCTSGRTGTMTWDGSEWGGGSSPDSNVIRMFCQSGTWKMQDGLTFEIVAGSSLTCSPFSVQFVFSGGFTWTVTA